MNRHLSPPRVFLADDSDLIRRRVRAMLDEGGCCIVGEARTPRTAVHGILASKPDVVVLDAQLEGGSGMQVLRALHEIAPEVPFVVFSNNAAQPWRERYLGAGAHAFLDKSTEFHKLAGAVSKACGLPCPPVSYA